MPARLFARLPVLVAGPAFPAAAQDAPPVDTISTGIGIGTAIFILLAVLIGLSVVAKLLIVFGVVPRQAENGFHVIVHGAANFVGGLTRPGPRRRNRPHNRGN
ncbi:MAG TPA: hypothetical protein VFK86_21615 [Bauldia sp.]|nr:hypothetical protein [Bauldia sp.]